MLSSTSSNSSSKSILSLISSFFVLIFLYIFLSSDLGTTTGFDGFSLFSVSISFSLVPDFTFKDFDIPFL